MNKYISDKNVIREVRIALKTYIKSYPSSDRRWENSLILHISNLDETMSDTSTQLTPAVSMIVKTTVALLRDRVSQLEAFYLKQKDRQSSL